MFKVMHWLQSPFPELPDRLFESAIHPDLWQMSESEKRYLLNARSRPRPQTIILTQPRLPNLLEP